jgi:lipoprotein-anchoring transpeptidase ErfK/SrfK
MWRYLVFLAFITQAQAIERVSFHSQYPKGTIVISSSERALYLTEGSGTALRYPVAVGKSGKSWRGVKQIDGKHVRPAWVPPAEVRREIPNIPSYIEGGAKNNPMGERALTLNGGDYAIHGTNKPNSIGKAASFGCIRMYNADIIDLFDRVKVGGYVVVN